MAGPGYVFPGTLVAVLQRWSHISKRLAPGPGNLTPFRVPRWAPKRKDPRTLHAIALNEA